MRAKLIVQRVSQRWFRRGAPAYEAEGGRLAEEFLARTQSAGLSPRISPASAGSVAAGVGPPRSAGRSGALASPDPSREAGASHLAAQTERPVVPSRMHDRLTIAREDQASSTTPTTPPRAGSATGTTIRAMSLCSRFRATCNRRAGRANSTELSCETCYTSVGLG